MTTTSTRTPRRLSRDAEREMLTALRSSLSGEVIGRDDATYDMARAVWNGLIDRRPAAIARPAGTVDVVEAVRIAREFRPVVSIRGGGHQVAGSAVCDDGLVIDMSAMNAVQVDPEARVAHVQAGARWRDVDRETQRFGLATPGGEVSLTGVAGLTLGGGMGLLMRAHGLSCDNVRAIDIVTADGRARHATRDEHADLFWAARGGGRGLGVVTTFEFDLHPIGPDVAVAQVAYAYDDAERVVRAWRDVAPHMSERVSPELALWSVLPDPNVPLALHNVKAVVVAGVYAGPPEDGAAILAPLKQLAEPLLDQSGVLPYVAVQSAIDAVVPDGGRYYMKSHFMHEVTDRAVATVLECDASRPTPKSVIVFRTLGGAVAGVAADQTAFAHRSASFNLSTDAFWFDPALDRQCIDWSRNTWEALRPFSTGGVYVNFGGLEEENDAQSEAVLGRNQERLARVRASYDPDGLFEAAAHRL